VKSVLPNMYALLQQPTMDNIETIGAMRVSYLVLHLCLWVPLVGSTEPIKLNVKSSEDGSQIIALPAWEQMTDHHGHDELFAILRLGVVQSEDGRSRGLIFHDSDTHGYMGAASVSGEGTETELLCRVVQEPKAIGGDEYEASTNGESGAALLIRGDLVEYAHWLVMPVNPWPAESAVDSSESHVPLVFFKQPSSKPSDVAKIVVERDDDSDGNETNWKALLVHAYGSTGSQQRCVPGGYSGKVGRTATDNLVDDWSKKPCRPLKELHRCLLADILHEQDANEHTMSWLTFKSFGAFFLHDSSTPRLASGTWMMLFWPQNSSNPAGQDSAVKVKLERGMIFSSGYMLLCLLSPVAFFALVIAVTMKIDSEVWSLLQQERPGTDNREGTFVQRFVGFLKYKFSVYEEAHMPYSFASQLLICLAFVGPLASQYVLKASGSMDRLGNRDECRYNENCFVPGAGYNLPANNLWSNAPYFTVGVMFGCLVLHHDFLCTTTLQKPLGCRRQDFTLFYAMAIAFVAEAVMSSVYHVCPHRINFQFDSFFMFVIPTLGTLALSQNGEQHVIHEEVGPDVWEEVLNPQEEKACQAAKVRVLMLPAGSVRSVSFFGIFVAPLGILNILGSRKNSRELEHGDAKPMQTLLLVLLVPWLWATLSIHGRFYGEGLSRQRVAWLPGLLGPPMTAVGITWAWSGRLLVCSLVCLAVIKQEDISLLFLALCLGSMICLLIRVVARTWPKLQTPRRRNLLFHACLFLVMSVAALYVFVIPTSEKTRSPAESRAESKHAQCVFGSPFDTHDVWHLLSALALGCYALLVLDLAQGPSDIRRLTLPVGESQLELQPQTIN